MPTVNDPEQKRLADDMLAFLNAAPVTPDLQWTRDPIFLFHFEAHRQLIMQQMLRHAGFSPDRKFTSLDFGFLHGLTPEFLHRAFPQSQITVCDLPSSPIFQNSDYLAAIQKREYLRLLPLNINDLDESSNQYDLITIGEVIEHLDPTQVAKSLTKLRKLIRPGGTLLITTPNASGLYNCYMTMRQKDAVQVAPIPDKTHGYGHIHLWSPNILRQTAEHFGWQFKEIQFYHGREAEMFARAKQNGSPLKARLFLKLLKLFTERSPKLKGFFVATFVALP